MAKRLPTPLQNQHCLRAHAVAELLDVNVRTVRRWIADGTLRSIKIGGARLVAKDDLQRLLRASDGGREG